MKRTFGLLLSIAQLNAWADVLNQSSIISLEYKDGISSMSQYNSSWRADGRFYWSASGQASSTTIVKDSNAYYDGPHLVITYKNDEGKQQKTFFKCSDRSSCEDYLEMIQSQLRDDKGILLDKVGKEVIEFLGIDQSLPQLLPDIAINNLAPGTLLQLGESLNTSYQIGLEQYSTCTFNANSNIKGSITLPKGKYYKVKEVEVVVKDYYQYATLHLDSPTVPTLLCTRYYSHSSVVSTNALRSKGINFFVAPNRLMTEESERNLEELIQVRTEMESIKKKVQTLSTRITVNNQSKSQLKKNLDIVSDPAGLSCSSQKSTFIEKKEGDVNAIKQKYRTIPLLQKVQEMENSQQDSYVENIESDGKNYYVAKFKDWINIFNKPAYIKNVSAVEMEMFNAFNDIKSNSYSTFGVVRKDLTAGPVKLFILGYLKKNGMEGVRDIRCLYVKKCLFITGENSKTDKLKNWESSTYLQVRLNQGPEVTLISIAEQFTSFKQGDLLQPEEIELLRTSTYNANYLEEEWKKSSPACIEWEKKRKGLKDIEILQSEYEALEDESRNISEELEQANAELKPYLRKEKELSEKLGNL